MKKKGFTLIELLAVIVILAIIALIATPMVLNTIEKAKQGAAVASAYEYAEEVERYIILSELDPTLPKLQPGVEYKLSKEKNEVAALADPATTYINDLVSIKGDKPTSGYLKLDSEYKIEKMEMVIKSYPVTCEKDECKVTGSKVEEEEKEPEEEIITGPTSEEPDKTKTKGLIKIVYLDPTDLTKTCNASNSVSTTGTKTGCMKWYVYKDDGTNYTMILDHNTTALVAYNSEGNNTEMKEAKNELDNLVLASNWKVTPRLITADEIAKITGANSNDTLKWDSTKSYGTDDIETQSGWYYLDGTGTTYSNIDGWQKQVEVKSNYSWLFDYTNSCTSYGCNVEDSSNFGYWTSTPVAGAANTSHAWYVTSDGRLGNYIVSPSDTGGVRPVITISKSILS